MSPAEYLLEILLRSPTYLYIQPCLLPIKSQAYIPFHQFRTGPLAEVTIILVKMREFIVLVGSLTIFAIVFPTMATDKDGFNFYKGEFELCNSILPIFFAVLISHLLFIYFLTDFFSSSFFVVFCFRITYFSFFFLVVVSDFFTKNSLRFSKTCLIIHLFLFVSMFYCFIKH